MAKQLCFEIWTFELERLIESISKLSDDYTLLGDLNCNILEPDKEPKLGRHFLNLCDVYAWPCPSHEERPASARGAVLGAPREEAPGQTTRHLAEDHRGRDENSWKDVERAALAGPGPV